MSEIVTESGSVDGGPGLVYMPFVIMEDLLDKLKLLNYEEVKNEYVFRKVIIQFTVPCA